MSSMSLFLYDMLSFFVEIKYSGDISTNKIWQHTAFPLRFTMGMKEKTQKNGT